MFFEFVREQWLLFVMLGVIIILLFLDPAKRRVAGVSSLNQNDALRLLQKESSQVIDVSEESDFKAGHIAGAESSPSSKLANDIDRLSKFKDKDVVVVCRTGQRSGKAASMLTKAGFTKVHLLDGGMVSWMKENLPVERS